MKHIVLSTLALACSLCCNAQGTIEGNISNLDDGTVYLEFGRGIQDSCQSNNGRFKLNIPAFKGESLSSETAFSSIIISP